MLQAVRERGWRPGNLYIEQLTGQWLRHPASFTRQAWRQFRALREADLKTARAWALKESLMRTATH